MKLRQWIDIEIPEFKDPHCFQVSKFITRLLGHSMQEKAFRRYRILVRRNVAAISPMLRIGLLKNGYQFWRKVEDRRKGSRSA